MLSPGPFPIDHPVEELTRVLAAAIMHHLALQVPALNIAKAGLLISLFS